MNSIVPQKKKILIACERSGIVRSAFAARGYDAWSVDLVTSDRPGNHIIGDALETIRADHWDMVIAHPPCTYLSRAAARYWSLPGRSELSALALQFVLDIWNCDIPRLAIENPIGKLWRWRPPDQIIQPYQFGDPVQKTTCLWLRGLPPLMSTLYCADYEKDWTDKKHRTAAARSQTFPGIANAMADQW